MQPVLVLPYPNSASVGDGATYCVSQSLQMCYSRVTSPFRQINLLVSQCPVNHLNISNYKNILNRNFPISGCCLVYCIQGKSSRKILTVCVIDRPENISALLPPLLSSESFNIVKSESLPKSSFTKATEVLNNLRTTTVSLVYYSQATTVAP